MSDERIASRLPSLTSFDSLGILEDELFTIPEDGPSISEQNTPTLNVDIDQETSRLEIPCGTVKEDKAIQFLLRSGISPHQIIQCVKTYKASKEAGNHGALDVISGVQPEELPERIRTVEARLPSTVPTPVHLKREFSEDFDEEPDSSLPGTKRARMAFMDEEPRPTDLPKLAQTKREGCPGDRFDNNLGKKWKCKPEELTKRKCWTSFKKFREHFDACHLETYGTRGSHWQCSFCRHSFAGNGHALIKHNWDGHFG